MSEEKSIPTGLYGLVAVVDRLLGPGGCPWDQEQTHESLKKYLLEEAYEVLDAIDSGSVEKLKEELGDLLLQPIMHAQMEKLAGGWDIDAVADRVVEKLVSRHPHVFGDTSVADADEVLRNWDQIKKAEGGEGKSILGGVPAAMPSLLRAHEISKRAARVGFEWPSIDAVFDKLHEEEAELKEAMRSANLQLPTSNLQLPTSNLQPPTANLPPPTLNLKPPTPHSIENEIGDLLFTVVNIARWLDVEPEEALRKMLNRFTKRFMSMERTSNKPLRELSAEEWDELWEKAKESEVRDR